MTASTARYASPDELPSPVRSGLRMGAAAGIAGVVVEFWMASLHAGHADPNDSATVFLEYAGSDIWTAVHIGQFLGAALVGVALLALAWTLSRQGGLAGILGQVGGVVTIVLIAVFAVQMAVDGVALKAAIAAWVAAPDPVDRSAAFYVADGVRSIEKGLSGFFNLLNGGALMALGSSIATGRIGSRLLGVVGVAAGIGFVAGGYSAAHTGFSPAAGAFLSPAALLSIIFLAGIGVLLWRRGGTRQERGLVSVPA